MRMIKGLKNIGEWIVGVVMLVVLLVMLFFSLFPFASDSAKEDASKYDALSEPRSSDVGPVFLVAHNSEITKAHVTLAHTVAPTTGTTAITIAAEGFFNVFHA